MPRLNDSIPDSANQKPSSPRGLLGYHVGTAWLRMLIPLTFLLVAQPSPEGALKRLEAYLKPTYLRAEFSISASGVKATGTGSMELRRGYGQRVVMRFGESNFDWIQDPSGSLWIDHAEKTYREFPSLGQLHAPGKWASEQDGLLYPSYLLDGGFPKEAAALATARPGAPAPPATKWVLKKSDPSGDYMELVTQAMTDIIVQRIQVHPTGRLVEYSVHFGLGEKAPFYKLKFTKWNFVAPPNLNFDLDLPLRYTPHNLPYQGLTIPVGEIMPLGEWLNARTNQKEPVKSKMGSKGLLIMVTAPDCGVSVRGEAGLRQVGASFAKEGYGLAEISFGQDSPVLNGKDPARPIYWDRDGQIEKETLIPQTPYFLLLDKDGRIQSAYYGWWKGAEPKIIRALQAKPGL